MSLRTSRRTAARTVAVTTVLAGAVLAPTVTAFAAPGSASSDKCVVVLDRTIGAGTTAVMTIGPDGPSVSFKDTGDGTPTGGRIDRKHPKLPASAGFVAEILQPNSSAPKLFVNMEGGGHKGGTVDFPKLPKGCTFDYATDTGQTKDVPKGGVAAGAEYEQGSGPSPITVGAAAAAAAAAGLGFVVMRRRAASAGR